MTLFLLLVACGGPKALLGNAEALAEAGRYDDAIATYDELIARWPERYPYARRLVEAWREGGTDTSLDAITALLSDSNAPADVHAAAGGWACQAPSSFRAWDTCGAVPEGDTRAFVAACDRLEALAALCPEPGAESLRTRAARRKLLADRDIAEATALLGASGDSSEVVSGASGLNPGLTGLGGLLGPRGEPVGAGGLGSDSSGLGREGTAEGLGGLGAKSTAGAALGLPFAEEGARVQALPPIVAGSLHPSLVEEGVKRHLAQVGYCYQREQLSDPDLSGKVTVAFTIARDGAVVRAEVDSSTLGHADVEACVVGRFMRMWFPAPTDGGLVTVRQPLTFSAE